MLSPNGSSDTCIADGVFHIPMPCFHGAPDPCVTGQSEGLGQRFELVKDGILTPPKDIRQDGSRMMINSMPEPT